MVTMGGTRGSAPRIAVIGAGPAGLTAATVLANHGVPAVVFEGGTQVGGLARTVVHGGNRFDLGGHRFVTKLAPVERLWRETLGSELWRRDRLSRIYYEGKYFAYPLEAQDIVTRIGAIDAARCLLSYLRQLVRNPRRRPETFEDWVTSRFGRRLYDTFFASYTEKVWGIPGSEIRSEWAAQRIRNFSLWRAVFGALGLPRGEVTTLVEEFLYPRLGPGQMWEKLADEAVAGGVAIELENRCIAVRHEDGRVRSVVVEGPEGRSEHEVDELISTMPLNELVAQLEPAAPPDVVAAARRLRYRSMCVVALVTKESQTFPDNWIYLHDPGVRAGRVQNFGAWSPDMVEPGKTCLGVEYFCFEGDDLWEMPEAELVALARDELASVGLVDPSLVLHGKRVRVRHAYPVYDGDYREALAVVRDFVARFSNLHTCGRNGLHRYNNMDHSMWTAALATLNAVEGTSYDVWSVNTDEAYLEHGEAVDDALLTGLLRRTPAGRASPAAGLAGVEIAGALSPA